MPSFLTHYACGVECFNNMKDGVVRSCISAHKSVYDMGLAGPDVFFYSFGEMSRGKKAIGGIIHRSRCGEFLRKLYETTRTFAGDDRKIAVAYFTGFLGHYELDSSAHPLIFHKAWNADQKVSYGLHYRYEAAMDGYTCRYVLHKDILYSHQMGLIHLDGNEKRVIAEMLSEAFTEVFPDSGRTLTLKRMKIILHEYYLISGLLMDPTGFKEWVSYMLEKYFRGYAYLSPLFVNSNRYGVTPEDYRQFRKRFDRGVRWFEKVTEAEERAIRNPSDQTAEQEFFRQIGNRSYHTGQEPCAEPFGKEPAPYGYDSTMGAAASQGPDL